MKSLLLGNARIVNEGDSFLGYVGIRDGKIDKIGKGDAPAEVTGLYDAADDIEGKLLIPGVIDDQVHFRDPGLTHKADMQTESRAAVAGGVTSFMDMPNTKPQTVAIEAWKNKCRRAEEVSVANYAFFIGATKDNIDELRHADFSRIPGVKVFLGASTGNMLVDSEEALDRIFSLPALVAIHSEDEQTIRRNAAEAREKYGDNVPIEMHPEIRSAEACIKSTGAAIARAKRLGTRLHILHLSTAGEAQMLESGDCTQKQITGEACVHHLWFTDADYGRLGTRIKWNPAVKTESDRAELRKALRDGRIDIVATDHAPHLLSEKEGDALHAASGGPLVQYSLLVMLELARQGVFSTEEVVKFMCHNPARLFGVEKRGFIREGYYADLVVIDPEGKTVASASDVLSRCGWTPFEGTEFSARVERTYVNGEEAFRGGKVNDAVRGMPLRFKR